MSWQNEVLLERLRAKSNHVRALADLARCARSQLLDRCQLVTSHQREQLRACLQMLQQRVGVCSQQSCMDRIQAVSEEMDLQFVYNGGDQCTVDAGLFQLSVHFEPTRQTVMSVRLRHEAHDADKECALLTRVLANGEFVEFGEHLRGLLDVYSVEVSAAVKPRLYTLLNVCEEDVQRLASLVKRASDVVDEMVDAGLGFVVAREGGRAMRLTFLVPPRQLIDTATNRLQPLKAETLSQHSAPLGYWAEVRLAPASSPRALPCTSLISPKSTPATPVFLPLSSVSTLSLPAVTTLKLSRPLPLDDTTCRFLERLTGSQPQLVAGEAAAVSIWQLLTGEKRVLHVKLPGQQLHCYHVDLESSLTAVNAIAVPFTHVAQLRRIVARLRRQALLHALLVSVVRRTPDGNTQEDAAATVSCEVAVPNCVCINLTVCHAQVNQLFRMRVCVMGGSVSTLQCYLYDDAGGWKSDVSLTHVLRATLSLPVTVRALVTRVSRSFEVKLPEALSVTGRGSLEGSLMDGVTVKREPEDPVCGIEMSSDSPAVFPSSAAALTSGSGLDRSAGGGFEAESGVDTSPCDELRNIESTVRQIEMDKAQGGLRVAQSLARDILGLSGNCAPNIPSSLTITPIPPADKMAKTERRGDRERGEKRRRCDLSPASRSPRDSDDLLSPARPSSKITSKHSMSSSKHVSKSSVDSPPFKRHSTFANSPSKSPASLAAMSTGSAAPALVSSSKVSSSKFSTSASKFPSSSSPVTSSMVVESGGDHGGDSLRDQIKSLIARGEMNELAASQSRDMVGARGGDDVMDSRRGYLSDVITKLNSIVADESGTLRDERKSEFIVKPSGTDGIKLTINKTKSRSSSSSPIGSRHATDQDRSSPAPAVKAAFSPVPAASRKALYRPEEALADSRGMLAQESMSGRCSLPAAAAVPGTGRTMDKRELALDRELPPLPKSLEIKKIGRSTESPVSQPGGGGGGRWSGFSSSSSSHDRSPTHTIERSGALASMGSRTLTPSSLQMHMMSGSVSSDTRRGQSGAQSAPCLIDSDIADDALMALGK